MARGGRLKERPRQAFTPRLVCYKLVPVFAPQAPLTLKKPQKTYPPAPGRFSGALPRVLWTPGEALRYLGSFLCYGLLLFCCLRCRNKKDAQSRPRAPSRCTCPPLEKWRRVRDLSAHVSHARGTSVLQRPRPHRRMLFAHPWAAAPTRVRRLSSLLILSRARRGAPS